MKRIISFLMIALCALAINVHAETYGGWASAAQQKAAATASIVGKWAQGKKVLDSEADWEAVDDPEYPIITLKANGTGMASVKMDRGMGYAYTASVYFVCPIKWTRNKTSLTICAYMSKGKLSTSISGGTSAENAFTNTIIYNYLTKQLRSRPDVVESFKILRADSKYMLLLRDDGNVSVCPRLSGNKK